MMVLSQMWTAVVTVLLVTAPCRGEDDVSSSNQYLDQDSEDTEDENLYEAYIEDATTETTTMNVLNRIKRYDEENKDIQTVNNNKNVDLKGAIKKILFGHNLDAEEPLARPMDYTDIYDYAQNSTIQLRQVRNASEKQVSEHRHSWVPIDYEDKKSSVQVENSRARKIEPLFPTSSYEDYEASETTRTYYDRAREDVEKLLGVTKKAAVQDLSSGDDAIREKLNVVGVYNDNGNRTSDSILSSSRDAVSKWLPTDVKKWQPADPEQTTPAVSTRKSPVPANQAVEEDSKEKEFFPPDNNIYGNEEQVAGEQELIPNEAARKSSIDDQKGNLKETSQTWNLDEGTQGSLGSESSIKIANVYTMTSPSDMTRKWPLFDTKVWETSDVLDTTLETSDADTGTERSQEQEMSSSSKVTPLNVQPIESEATVLERSLSDETVETTDDTAAIQENTERATIGKEALKAAIQRMIEMKKKNFTTTRSEEVKETIQYMKTGVPKLRAETTNASAETSELTTIATTTASTTIKMDINAIIAIIANLTYDYEWNLTEEFNRTLIEHGIPSCPTPSTLSTTATTPSLYDFTNNTVMGKCFVCGLEDTEIPQNAHCADAFAGDFIPLVPVDPRARGQIAKFRKYCRYLDVHNYIENPAEPRSIYGRFTGGCAVRWTDLSGTYTQRTCRARFRPLMGKHFVSKRMAKLELSLINVENGCIITPMATLLPMSRGISLYARFHACVCTGNWCNRAVRAHSALYTTLLLYSTWLLTS